MTTIPAELVKELREKTGVGMMDCKKALAETKGDVEAAIDWLRKKGLAKAGSKAGWMLIIRPSQCVQNPGVSNRMKPARQTMSTRWASRRSSIAASKAARSFPKAL